MRRVLMVAIWTAVLVGLTAAPAAAHAQLERSEPTGGGTVEQPPRRVTLWFSERVEASFSGVQVFDPSGSRVDRGDPRVDGAKVQVPLRRVTVPGTYTVVFRIISGDSHPVESKFDFAFEPAALTPSPSSSASATPSAAAALTPDTTASAAPTAPPPSAPEPVDITLEGAGAGTVVGLWLARLGNYLALSAVVGMLLLAGVLLGGDEPEARRSVRAAAVAAAVLAVSAAALFVFGLSTAAARPLPGVLDWDLVRRFAATRLGWVVLAQTAVAVVLAVAAVVARTARALLVVAALAGLAPVLWGHAGSNGLAGVAVASDWVHVLAATVWVGGLAALAWHAWLHTDRELAVPAHRFSRLAAWALAAVLATGVVNAVVNLGAVGQLWTTVWGRLVLVKVALFAVIVVLGAINRRRVLPRLSRASGPDAARAVFRRFAVLEVVVMVAAFGTATGLASSIPADAEAASRVQSMVAAFGEGEINLTVDPAKVGANVVHLYFLDETGRPRTVTRPGLTLTIDGRRQPVTLTPTGPGHLTALGHRLPAAGPYDVAVTAVVDGAPERATGTITVQ